jgi:hypothetical protein
VDDTSSSAGPARGRPCAGGFPICLRADRLRQLENLVREAKQLLVLAILVLNCLPCEIGDYSALGVCSVLADHHERREEDRLERYDHRQETVGVPLDAEDDSRTEPEQVQVHEGHRACKIGDAVDEPVLPPLRSLAGVL